MIATNSRVLWIDPLLIAVCLVGVAASAETSTYVFVPDQSTVVQTGGIAGVPRTYSIKGEFQLTVDPNLGTASFAQVDANATDDSPFKRTLDLNHVFNMTSLVGTVVDDTTIKFTGKASDESDVGIAVTLQDGLAHLVGQTTPPPNSADFFIFNLDAVAQRKYGGGSGTPDDPYQIATAADLVALGETPEDYDKHFILTADIDLDPNLPGRKVFDKAVIAPATLSGGRPTVPVLRGTPFTGVFDGNGRTISHLTTTGGGFLGLFGWLASGAEVRGLGVVDVNITGSSNVAGGLVGSSEGALTGCYSTGVVRGRGCVGGLAGDIERGTVTACYSTAAASGVGFVGGLVGCSQWAHVTDCYSTGAVKGSGDDAYVGYVGGLVGYNGPDTTLTDCYSTGAVSGNSFVGGLVGANAESGFISHCYGTGAVDGDDNVGGLVGQNSGTVTQCYSAGAVEGSGDYASVGGLVGDAWSRSAVTRCYSTGRVTSTGELADVGGLVGANSGAVTQCYSTGGVNGGFSVGGLVGRNCGTVTYCYSSGTVKGGDAIGGLAGLSQVDVTACFWDTQTSGQTASAGGTGKTTAEMKTASTFLEAGWDFVNVWGIGENQTYPYLRKYSAVDINQDSSVNFLDLAVLAENWLTDISHR